MRTLAATAAYAASIVYLAWPLPADMAGSLVDALRLGGPWGRADLDLLVWILAWDAHALATAPGQLFDGNIFYPALNVLASSEHLLGLAPLAAPVFWLTDNAVLTYNATVLVTVLVTACATFALVRAWTGDAAAAFLAGAAFAFAPSNVLDWTRLHVTAVHLVPLVLLLAWRAAARPRAHTLALLAAATALQTLAGVYVAYELLFGLLAFAPALWWEARRHGRSGRALAAAVAGGGLLALPVSIPYLRARAAGVLPESGPAALELVSGAAPAIAGVLRTDLTVPVLALALVGLAARHAPPHLRWGLAAVAVAGVLLALGPRIEIAGGVSLPGPYAVAAAVVPGFAGMRAPPRFLVLPLLALALLAGVGGAALAAGLDRRGLRPLGTGLLLAGGVALVLARGPATRLPLAAAPLDGPGMAVYHWLAAHGAGRPVLEIPALTSVMDGRALLATGRYMLGSTLHWLPLVNGYTGHPPATTRLLPPLAQRLPDRVAFDDLCAVVDLGWLIVHPRDLPDHGRVWEETLPAGLKLAARPGGDLVYRVDRACGRLLPALRRELAGAPATTTLGGVPLAPLPLRARRGGMSGILPRHQLAGGWVNLAVEVRNRSRTPWPGLTTRTEGSVALQARWVGANGRALESATSPLAHDLAPRERVRVLVGTMTPPPGAYVLEIGLLQEGSGWFAAHPGGAGILRRRVRVVP